MVYLYRYRYVPWLYVQVDIVVQTVLVQYIYSTVRVRRKKPNRQFLILPDIFHTHSGNDVLALVQYKYSYGTRVPYRSPACIRSYSCRPCVLSVRTVLVYTGLSTIDTVSVLFKLHCGFRSHANTVLCVRYRWQY